MTAQKDEIRRVAAETLRDAGLSEPPLSVKTSPDQASVCFLPWNGAPYFAVASAVFLLGTQRKHSIRTTRQILRTKRTMLPHAWCFSDSYLQIRIDQEANYRRGGIVAEFEFELLDIRNERHSMQGWTFYNQHYLLSLIVRTDESRNRE
jgi:hypothetical protein